jgi:hypothetical protein
MSPKQDPEKIVREIRRKTRRTPQGRLGKEMAGRNSFFTFEISEIGR